MKKKRIVPIVLFKDGHVVQTKTFSEHRNLGNPFDSIRRLSEWGADEVCFIDIGSRSGGGSIRSDLGRATAADYLEVLETVSVTSSMPLSSGGQIRSMGDIELRLMKGADKVTINSAAFEDQRFMRNAIESFGSQCIVVSIDIKKIGNDYFIFTKNGSQKSELTIEEAVNSFNRLEVGEILLNSIDRDGTKQGLDLYAIEYVSKLVRTPLVVCGGAGKWEDFESALQIDGVDGVAAANIFQHIDQSLFLAHKFLYDKGINVRKPQLLR